MGLGMASVSVLVLEQSPVADQGANSAAIQVSDALLSTVLIGAGGVIFAALHRGPGLDKDVFLIINAVMLAVALLGVLLAPRVRTVAAVVVPGVDPAVDSGVDPAGVAVGADAGVAVGSDARDTR
jgi:hypothetical protein